MRRCAISVVLAGLALSPACALLLPDGPNVRAGEELVVVEDSVIQETQGTTMSRLKHRELLRGRVGSVVPVGAVVQVADRNDPRVRGTGSDAPLAHKNPWIYVAVTFSPYQQQVGWEGWIHHLTVRRRKPGADPEPQALALALARPSQVCPYPDSNKYQCQAQAAAGTPVRVIDCSGERVRVEMWGDRGLYMTGYVKRSQFDVNPCVAN